MTSKSYFVSHNGEQLGPFTAEEIVQKVGSRELSPMDYLYDESRQDWVTFLQHPEVSGRLSVSKPQAPPATTPAATATTPKLSVVPPAATGEPEHLRVDWYVLKGENKFGPFSFHDVVRMLQEKVAFEFDFAWHSGLDSWQRIAEVEAFSNENIKKLQTTLMPEIKQVFFRRRHRRARCNSSILVHDNKNVWKGNAVEISAGGAGVIMENAMLVPGQHLFLHFKPGDGAPPFNAVCEVVSKRYVDGVKDKQAPLFYGLRFKSINQQTQQFLTEFTKDKGAA